LKKPEWPKRAEEDSNMNKKGLAIGVICILVLMSTLAFARSSVIIDANCLIFRDTSGNEYKQCGAETITAGEVTVTSGSGAPVTTTGTETLTNKTLTSPIITTGTFDSNTVDFTGTDAQILVLDAGFGWNAVTMSGDGTITNALVFTIGNNKIGTAETNVGFVNVPIVASATSGTATVTSGSTILGFYPFANIDAEVANIVAISGTTLTVTLQSAAALDAVVYRVVILEP